MEFRKPKPKRKFAFQGNSKLTYKNKNGIVGIFNGDSVTVEDSDSMIYLYEMGNFGKGSLSKGLPNYGIKRDDIPEIIFEHQFENQIKWNAIVKPDRREMLRRRGNDAQLSIQSLNSFLQASFSGVEEHGWKTWKENRGSQNLRKFGSNQIDLSFLEFKTDEADYEDEHFKSMVNDILDTKKLKMPKNLISKANEVIIVSTDVNPHLMDFSSAVVNARLDVLPQRAVESLKLNLEESLFLKSVFGCLNIVDLNSSEMDIPDLWEKFKAAKNNFPERYVTYHYYRSKGWIVRSGLKFGGDFLLYKTGPAHYHASYLVKVFDGRKKITWREFLAMNRLVETFNKDLLLNYVTSDSTTENKSFPHLLSRNSVQEILVKRWLPSKERLSKTNED